MKNNWGFASCRKKHYIVAVLLCVIIMILATATVSYAEDKSGGSYAAAYQMTVYDKDSGLAGGVNAIAQTDDGYIWLGGYAGLIRFDGKSFEYMRYGYEICNVRALYVDSNGILWIGTNDNGIFYKEPGSDSITGYNVESGLSSNTVRNIVEGDDGRIYVATALGFDCIDADGNIKEIDYGVENIVIAAAYSPVFECVGFIDIDGVLRISKNCEIIKEFASDDIIYTAIESDDDGHFVVGDSDGNIYDFVDITQDKFEKIAAQSGIGEINCIINDEKTDGFFVGADMGAVYISADGESYRYDQEDFTSSVMAAMQDYQGNVWFGSSKQGLAKLSISPFENIFREADIPPMVVNSVTAYDNLIYVGGDNGLVIIDENNSKEIKNDLTRELEGLRIRNLYVDSKNNLWISIYSDPGLIRIDKAGQRYIFNSENGTVNSKFRFVFELSDGRIAAAGTSGIDIIEGDEVIRSYSESQGMEVPVILCAVETEDGKIYAGSDGAGIYVIKDDSIVDIIDTDDGLTGLVVLRIVPCSGGYIYVASNGLYYDDGYSIRLLDKFPYNNNYDLFLHENLAYVMSGRGIYTVLAGELIVNKGYTTSLIDSSCGLDTVLNSNSWNYYDGDSYYLCCTDGVRKYRMKGKADDTIDYEIGVYGIEADDKENIEIKDGTCTIPAGTVRLVFNLSVLNYSYTNPVVHVYLKGFDDAGITFRQKELSPVVYTNVPAGSYELHMEISNEEGGEILAEYVLKVNKKARIRETMWFKILLGLIAIMLIIGLTLLYEKAKHGTELRTQYEEVKKARDEAQTANMVKDRFLANMSHEIRTPINTVIGMNEMIMRESSEDHIKEYAANIQTASHTLLDMVEGILDFSRIESGDFEIKKEPYSFSQLIEDVKSSLEISATDKGLKYSVEVSDDVPLYVRGDEYKVRDILQNLITNAVKYTPHGEVGLSIKSEELKEDYRLIVTVRDTGIGISEDYLPMIFDGFARLERDKFQTAGGSGLGLSITKSIVEKMDGEITVESKVGEGSAFTVSFVQGALTEAETEELKKNSIIVPNNKKLAAKGVSILVVDDNLMNLAVIRNLLKDTGLDIDMSDGGLSGLNATRQKKYDLILMDHMMPEPDGVETLNILRNEEGNPNRDTAVIVLTANAIAGSREEYISKGFADYISKPVEYRLLERVLANYLPADKIKWIEQDDDKQEADTGMEDKVKPAHSKHEGLIDKSVGLGYCNGMEKVYLEILNTYCEQGEEYRESIEKFREQKDWKNCAIIYHATKSTSLTIGAVAFSETAKGMELAAKAGDEAYIEANHGRFCTERDMVLEEVKSMLLEDSVNAASDKDSPGLDEDKESVPVSSYRILLEKLNERITNFEMLEAQESLKELERLDIDELSKDDKAQIADMLSELGRHLEDYDVDEAEKLVAKILEKLKSL